MASIAKTQVLWLVLAGCGPSSSPTTTGSTGTDTTCVTDTAEDCTDPGDPFGTDDDGDGFTEREGDCDDSDPDVHIAAYDAPGDGVDADCDNMDGPSLWAGLASASYDESDWGAPMCLGSELAVGDVNGDGLDEVLVGASHCITSGVVYGTVVRLDGSTLDPVTFWSVSEELDEFGIGLAVHTDLSGDGHADFVASNDRTAYVLPAGQEGTPLWAGEHASTIVAESDDHFASYVAVGPDWNDDGVPELVVWARDASPAVPEDGVHYLGVVESPYPPRIGASDLQVVAPGFFYDILAVDLDGDGTAEIAARGESPTGDYELYLLDGPGGGEPDPAFSHSSSELAPHARGDLDGDGTEDLVVGGWMLDDPAVGDRAGRAFILNRKPDARNLDPLAEPLQVHAAGPHDFMGFSAAIGDFNGDGQDDLAVGASGDPYFSDLPGRVHIWLGPITGPLYPEDSWFAAHGEAPSDSFGKTVAAGDIDGDGLDDLVVGATHWNELSGKVYLFLGSSM